MTEFYQDKVNPFTAFEIEEGGAIPPIPLTHRIYVNQAYCKPDMDLMDMPGLCLIMQDENRNRFRTLISLRTLKPVIEKLLEQEKKQLAKGADSGAIMDT